MKFPFLNKLIFNYIFFRIKEVKGIGFFYKILKEFKKPKYKEHIDMKQFMKSASSDYNNRSKALKDRDLQMKANQAFGPNASKSDNDNDKNVQNKNDNADNKKPTHDDNKHEDAE